MYKNRREKLATMLPDNALLFVVSGKEVHSVGDEMYPFAVDRNFFYYTGIDRPNMIYILSKVDGKATDHLVIERFDEMMAKWVGAKMPFAGCRAWQQACNAETRYLRNNI